MMGKTTKTITHIISRHNKWAVVKSKGLRATKLFDYREQAYHYAMLRSDTVIVHNTDGTVLFLTKNYNENDTSHTHISG